MASYSTTGWESPYLNHQNGTPHCRGGGREGVGRSSSLDNSSDQDDDHVHDEDKDDNDGLVVDAEKGHLQSSRRSVNKRGDGDRSNKRQLKQKRSSLDIDHGNGNGNNQFLLPLPPAVVPPRRRRIRRRNDSRTNGSRSSTSTQKNPTAHKILESVRRCSLKVDCCSNKGGGSSSRYSTTLVLAVLLWYTLGVVSISTSKILLTPPRLASIDHDSNDHFDGSLAPLLQQMGGVPPLFLTLQQLLLGCTFLRFLLNIQFFGMTTGLQPWENLFLVGTHVDEVDGVYDEKGKQSARQGLLPRAVRVLLFGSKESNNNLVVRNLLLSGIFFGFGFYTTNMAFGSASPAYVETIKAAEPITSAILAVSYGIERLTGLEVSSLGGIVAGVLLSTLSSSSSGGGEASSNSTMTMTRQSILASIIVMTSNLCFSFRGLYQKLYRHAATSAGNAGLSISTTASSSTVTALQLDDLNLQFRMQQTGVAMFLIPTILWDGPQLFHHLLKITLYLPTSSFVRVVARYFALSVGNGLAFSCYK